MRIPVAALDLIKKFEGLRLDAYLCPAGVATIGYGSTYWPSGRQISLGEKLQDKGQAESLLIYQLEKDFLPALEQIPHWWEMNDNRRAALISFAWNMGAHFYGAPGFNTISAALQSRNWSAVPSALQRYVRAGGDRLPGLVVRRKEEAKLWQIPIDNADIEEINLINYFLDFSLGLDNDGVLEAGRLVLRSVSPQGGRTHQIWVATSSVANKQKPEDFHQKGGPIPPEYRVPGLKAWQVETTPIAMPQVKGVEGNFYKITPYLIKTDKGGERGDFGVHRDANVPGSAGCIVMSGDRFKTFEAEMKRLKDLGYLNLPLFVTYPTND